MTDNEIIKALKIHANRGACAECAYGELPSCNCQMQMFNDCFDLINRQKAEIERAHMLGKLEGYLEGYLKAMLRLEKS